MNTIFCLFGTMIRSNCKGLDQFSANRDPLEIFKEWFEAASKSGIELPEAMSLATATRDARPSNRIVLLKEFDKDGFKFYTNHESRKALELDENPRASLVFHWAILRRQIRIEGDVTRIPEKESFKYFKTRPRNSQIGSWASQQSASLDSREILLGRFEMYQKQFSGIEVPLPPFWGGYLLLPSTIEFWEGRDDRLHDRLLFIRQGVDWHSERLFP